LGVRIRKREKNPMLAKILIGLVVIVAVFAVIRRVIG
jgi:hypothetical protein